MTGTWWAITLRGAAGVLFGVLALAMPGLSLAALVLLFGVYAIVEGGLTLVAAARGAAGRPRWVLLLQGVVSIAAGVVAFALPALTALVLIWLVGLWAMVTGALDVAAAIRLRREIAGEWRLALAGALSIVLGALLMLAPVAGTPGLVLLIGAYALVSGALLVWLGLTVRRRRVRGSRARPRGLTAGGAGR
jgi:uncharacterized membrane protein HdeD (DUF308 family)